MDYQVPHQAIDGKGAERPRSEPEASEAPEGWKKTPIFELDREIAVKRRSHYAG